MPSSGDLSTLKKAYDADGFVVIRGFLSPDEVRELSDKADSAMSDFHYHPKAVGIRKNLNRDDSWFEQYFEHGPQVPLIAGLLNDKPVPASTAFFDKPVGSSIEISQHIDGDGMYDGATIWIALDVADRGNGCLCYVKGSHQQSWNKGALAALNEDSAGAVVVEAEPGDAIIHSSRVVHWSRKSTCTTRRRRAISFFYWTSSCLADKKSWLGQRESPEALASELRNLDIEAGEAALVALKRDWAAKPAVVEMFRKNPTQFMAGLKAKDPDAFDAIVTAVSRM